MAEARTTGSTNGLSVPIPGVPVCLDDKLRQHGLERIARDSGTAALQVGDAHGMLLGKSRCRCAHLSERFFGDLPHPASARR